MRRLLLTVPLLLSVTACGEPRRVVVDCPPCESAKACEPASVAASARPGPSDPSSSPIPPVPSGLSLDLPKASSGPTTGFFAIDVTADGACYVDGKKLGSCEEVAPLAREAVAKDPGVRATIRADASVPHGKVMVVIDLLKQSGLNKIAFGVTKPASP